LAFITKKTQTLLYGAGGKNSSNSFHLFETTFEWNNKCLRVVSYAYLDTCEGYLEEISNWYE
jgi:hypothetical protein